MKGWHREHYRHALAARGITTSLFAKRRFQPIEDLKNKLAVIAPEMIMEDEEENIELAEAPTAGAPVIVKEAARKPKVAPDYSLFESGETVLYPEVTTPGQQSALRRLINTGQATMIRPRGDLDATQRFYQIGYSELAQENEELQKLIDMAEIEGLPPLLQARLRSQLSANQVELFKYKRGLDAVTKIITDNTTAQEYSILKEDTEKLKDTVRYNVDKGIPVDSEILAQISQNELKLENFEKANEMHKLNYITAIAPFIQPSYRTQLKEIAEELPTQYRQWAELTPEEAQNEAKMAKAFLQTVEREGVIEMVPTRMKTGPVTWQRAIHAALRSEPTENLQQYSAMKRSGEFDSFKKNLPRVMEAMSRAEAAKGMGDMMEYNRIMEKISQAYPVAMANFEASRAVATKDYLRVFKPEELENYATRRIAEYNFPGAFGDIAKGRSGVTRARAEEMSKDITRKDIFPELGRSYDIGIPEKIFHGMQRTIRGPEQESFKTASQYAKELESAGFEGNREIIARMLSRMSPNERENILRTIILASTPASKKTGQQEFIDKQLRQLKNQEMYLLKKSIFGSPVSNEQDLEDKMGRVEAVKQDVAMMNRRWGRTPAGKEKIAGVQTDIRKIENKLHGDIMEFKSKRAAQEAKVDATERATTAKITQMLEEPEVDFS